MTFFKSGFCKAVATGIAVLAVGDGFYGGVGMVEGVKMDENNKKQLQASLMGGTDNQNVENKPLKIKQDEHPNKQEEQQKKVSFEP